LRDIYTALGCPSLLAIGNRTEAPDCLVEQAVNAALDQAFIGGSFAGLSAAMYIARARRSRLHHRHRIASQPFRGTFPWLLHSGWQ
jgi:hypothetical protein